MNQREMYLMKAVDLFAKAVDERNPSAKADFESLVRAYLLLAVQAERNAQNDIV